MLCWWMEITLISMGEIILLCLRIANSPKMNIQLSLDQSVKSSLSDEV